MKQNKHAKSISFWTSRMALLLLLLIVAVAYLLVGTFAKYISSADGSDSARVARFAVSAEFTGAENSRTIRCVDYKDQTLENIRANSTVVYSPVVVTNTQTIGDVTYIAETSQKVDVVVTTEEAIHEVFGLEMWLRYGGQKYPYEYSGVDETGKHIYTFSNVCSFPVQADENGELIKQSFSCDLLLNITSDSVQPLTGVQLFVGAVGTQLN